MKLWVWLLIQYIRFRVWLEPEGGCVWLGTREMAIRVIKRMGEMK